MKAAEEIDIDKVEEEIQNKKAVNYDQLFFQSIAEFPLRKKIADYLFSIHALKTAKILDVGCGTGELLLYLKNSGFHNIAGNDISSGMLAVAQKKVQNANFYHGNINKCNIPEKFDYIIITEALHHIPDLRETFRTFHNLLTDKGQVILLEPNEHWYFENFKLDSLKNKMIYAFVAPFRKYFQHKNKAIIEENKTFDTPDTFSPVHRHLTVEEVEDVLENLKIVKKKYHTFYLGLFESCLFKKFIIDRIAYHVIKAVDSVLPFGNKGKYFFLILNKRS